MSAAKRAKTTSTANTNERFEFAKVMGELNKSKVAFTDAVQRCEAFETDTIESLNLQLTEKKAALAELETQFTIQKKDAEIKLKQEIAEFKYQAALNILKEQDQVPIDQAELTKLQGVVQAHATELEAMVKKARDEEKSSAHAQLSAAIKSKDLEHKASVAKLEAGVEQQQREIGTLNAQIVNYAKEVDKQRELTKQVADAGRQGAISQTIGKT